MNFTPGINNKKWQLLLIPVVAFIATSIISYNSNQTTYTFPLRLFYNAWLFYILYLAGKPYNLQVA
jgi:hypothetical protein